MIFLDIVAEGVLQTTALIQNLNGNFVGPENVEKTLKNIDVDNNNFADFLDMNGYDSYPFIMMNYVILNDKTKGKFFRKIRKKKKKKEKKKIKLK